MCYGFCMEILLVRFTRAQRAYIRKLAKRHRKSEAEVVRACVEADMKNC